MKHNTLYYILNDIKNYIMLMKFKADWRSKNTHNLTEANNIWPDGKVSVGKYTYGILNCHFFGTKENNEQIKIGNYCSIAKNTDFIAGGLHNEKCITTYPFFQKYGNKNDYQAKSNGTILVEDDVWIGMGVKIFSGVTIGKGAIIGAGSVVTKNIPPYAIAAGIPAKVIRYRFSYDTIENLKSLDLTKYNTNYILEHPKLFRSILSDEDINKITQKLK